MISVLIPFLFSTAASAAVSVSTPVANYDFAEQLKTEQSRIENDPLDLKRVLSIADLKLLTAGHAASREWLQSYLSRSLVLPPETTSRLQEKLVGLLSRFRLEEAQSLYFRGEIQRQNGDYTAALALFTQAVRQEPENLTLLNEKLLTEFHLGLYPAYYDTLSTVYTIVPFQRDLRVQLTEAHLKFKAYQKVIDLEEARPVGRSAREELALASAYYELGKKDLAVPLFRSLFSRLKDPASQFIITYYLGKSLAENEHLNAAKWNLLRSQRSARHLSVPRWDPYDLPGKTSAIPDLLAKLEAKMDPAEPTVPSAAPAAPAGQN